jgi:hypothetical protein
MRPHITAQQAKAFMSAFFKGDTGIVPAVTNAARQWLRDLVPGKH